MQRKERGPAPNDDVLFGAAAAADLRVAVEDLSWLLSRDYPVEASLKVVGDRYRLTARQRKAVQRCACSDACRDDRVSRRARIEDVAGADLSIDGFNCIIVTESVLSGAPVFRGRDGALRDLAGVHGTWHQLGVTDASLRALTRVLVDARAGSVRWLLDRPVSNSGRLRELLLSLGRDEGIEWTVEIVDDPDRVLLACGGVVATADARILDGCAGWVDLPAAVAEGALLPSWVVG